MSEKHRNSHPGEQGLICITVEGEVNLLSDRTAFSVTRRVPDHMDLQRKGVSHAGCSLRSVTANSRFRGCATSCYKYVPSRFWSSAWPENRKEPVSKYMLPEIRCDCSCPCQSAFV